MNWYKIKERLISKKGLRKARQFNAAILIHICVYFDKNLVKMAEVWYKNQKFELNKNKNLVSTRCKANVKW